MEAAMLRRQWIPIMLLLILALVLVVPTFAQELTPEVTATVVATGTPAPAGNSLFSAATLGELLLFLGLSGLAGGGIVAIILSFLGKKEVRDRVEDARNSWTPEQQQMLVTFTDLFERTSSGILDFLKAVQDGKPNEPLAQLTVMEGPALAKQSELDELSRKLEVLKRHYPIPQDLAKSILPHEEMPEDFTSGSPFPR
jgi:hypothetical protein